MDVHSVTSYIILLPHTQKWLARETTLTVGPLSYDKCHMVYMQQLRTTQYLYVLLLL